jgi:hypothetical protein
MAAEAGRSRELADLPAGVAGAIGRAIDFYETGDLWLGEAIEDAREG